MGMIPELPIAVLACARIGAVHSVIFGGFSASSIRDRVNDMGAKALICADGARRKGGVVDLKKAVDEALADGACPSLERVLVFEHAGNEVQWVPGRDHAWKQLAVETGTDCPCEPMDSEDSLFLLYTSGSTGNPRHTAQHGGLPHRRPGHGAMGLRPQGRRPLLVHSGPRLDHGPQLPGLWPLPQRRHLLCL